MTWQYVIDALPYVVISGLFGVVLLHYRKVQDGKLVPIDTVNKITAQHVEQMAAARQDFDKAISALERAAAVSVEIQARVIDSKDKDIENWRGAFHAVDQANREEDNADRDEMLAGMRALQRWLGAFQNQTGVPALPPSVVEVNRNAG